MSRGFRHDTNRTHSFLVYGLAAIIAVLLMIGYRGSPSSPSLSTPSAKVSDTSIIQELATALKNDPEFSPHIQQNNEGNLWWINEGGYNVIVDKSPEINIYIPAKYETGVKPVSAAVSQKFHSLFKQIAAKNGMIFNVRNSSQNIADVKYYDYISAYESGGVLCTAENSPDLEGIPGSYERSAYHISAQCTTKDKMLDAYNRQLPFLKALEAASVKGASFGGTALHNLRIDSHGKVATAGMNWRRTGSGAFFYNDGGGWKVVTVAQAVMPCDEMIKRNVPQDFWIGCYEKVGNTYSDKIREPGKYWKESKILNSTP